MVEIVNMSQWNCALTVTAMVKPSAKIEPFQFQKGNEICCILFFCNCPQNLFFLLLQQRFAPAGYIRASKDTNIMIGETFMHLRASLFDRNHSLHHITSVFVPFFFFSFFSSLGTRGLWSF